MPLSAQQTEALEQLCAVTASSTDAARERNERLLRQNGWNVQATVEQIFSMPDNNEGSNAGPSSATSSRANNVQDPLLPPTPVGSRRLSGTHSRPRPRGAAGTAGVGLGIFNVISWPFRLLVGIVGGVWYFIIRTFVPLSWLPHIPPLLLPPSSHPKLRPPTDPTTTSLNFVRDLESFTSCSSAAGTLPEIFVGPYREFLMHVRKEGLVGLVVLVSKEHEDDEEFKKGTLCDGDLIKELKKENVAVWAADISSREGYQVSQTLLLTAYPSLIFLSLLPSSPSPASLTGSGTHKLSILSSLSGSPASETSPTNIIQILQTNILPRTKPFLSRLRTQKFALEEARHLRAEQDRAFKAAEQRDREKMLAQKQKEKTERLRAERKAREEEEKAELAEKRRAWRRYARKHLLPPSKGPIRVALRTPFSPERHIRQFEPSSSTVPLFIYAETLLIPPSHLPADDPDSPPPNFHQPTDSVRGPEIAEEWPFAIVTAYPRKEVECVTESGEHVWEMIKQAGGALFVEKKMGHDWGREEGDEEDDEEDVVSDSD